MTDWQVIEGDCLDVLATLPDQSVHCCITSPPYWGLRDYGVDGQLGLESTPEEYVSRMVAVFRGVRRVLRDDGTLWLNLGDSYFTTPAGNAAPSGISQNGPKRVGRLAEYNTQRKTFPGLKPKDLVGIPWRVAFALQADGWYLRSDIIWAKPNPMPESVTDRPTKAHEYVFLLSKSQRYYYDQAAAMEPATDWGSRDRSNWCARDPRHNTGKPHTGGERCDFADTGRNRRTVWTIATRPFPGAHFAVFPPDLVIPMVDAGCPVGGTVLDPFAGSGTTGLVAVERGRKFIGIELNPEYAAMARERLTQATRQQRLPLDPAPVPEQLEIDT